MSSHKSSNGRLVLGAFGILLCANLFPCGTALANAAAALIEPNQPAPSTPGDALVKSGAIPLQSNTIADVAQAVAPAVVNIEVNKLVSAPSMQGMDLFNFFYGPQRQTPRSGSNSGDGHKIERHNMGSGFIIRADGYIVTNAHVVRGASKIKVALNDHRTFDGTVVGIDGFSDVAVVKINGSNLPTCSMGSSKNLRPGEFAIAIGNPLGFDHTVTFGIISAVKRTIADVNGNINFIQTDAAINPGNSGGPLLNLAGEVIGVNTAIQANAQNMGFSIPIDIVKDVAENIIEHKRIDRPWVGLVMADVDGTIAKSLGLPESTKGVLVARVAAKSPSESAGLNRGDVIEKIDGKQMETSKEVQDFVRGHKVGDELHFLVLRNNALKSLALTIGQYPDRPVTARGGSDEDSED